MLDVQKIRQQFPIYKNHPDLVYLDTGATSLKPQQVLDKINEYYTQYGANIHRGAYMLSYRATEEYDKARSKIANFIKARFEEIIFTRNVSAALNFIALQYGANLKEGDEVITSQLEHHSSVLPWMKMCEKKGAKLKYIPLSEEGRVTVEAFKEVVNDKTKVVALTYVSNVMGYITPIEEIIKIAHEKGAVVIVDAAQAVNHMSIDVGKLNCDFLAFSGHKMLGPTGIGVLYGKYSLLKTIEPLEYGGDMNDNVNLYDIEIKEIPYRFETGTPPIAEVIALGSAVDYLLELGFDNIKEHEKYLHALAIKQLTEIEGLEIYNKSADVAIIAFNVKGVHPHDAASIFDINNIALRAGHHCAQLITKHLKCDGGTLRASFYIYNDEEDVNKFIAAVRKTVDFFKGFGG